MKIISGSLKGRNFFMPKDIRPTPDKVRKAIFDILGHDFSGMRFIDLFAGSGSVGLEAISHNAAYVVFVEREIHTAEIINENINDLNIKSCRDIVSQYSVINADVFAAVRQLARQGKKFDIAFIDPPYGLELAKKALKTISDCDILQPNCFIVIQHDKHEILPEVEGRFLIVKKQKYGTSFLTIYSDAPYGDRSADPLMGVGSSKTDVMAVSP